MYWKQCSFGSKAMSLPAQEKSHHFFINTYNVVGSTVYLCVCPHQTAAPPALDCGLLLVPCLPSFAQPYVIDDSIDGFRFRFAPTTCINAHQVSVVAKSFELPPGWAKRTKSSTGGVMTMQRWDSVEILRSANDGNNGVPWTSGSPHFGHELRLQGVSKLSDSTW